MSALYETANDLTAIRDVDAILAAIVRRARSLLHADMTYLSLNDEADGASYMKVTDGALTPEFRRLRLPLGTGLLGLVAQTGEPYFTEDYQSDERFVHREFIDSAVDGEKIRAILGVPLTVEGKVIGALLAVHRTVRPFPPGEVSLLTSFAAHAAVALENARLFEQLDRANRQVRAQARRRRGGRAAPTTSSPTCCCTAAAWPASPTCSPTCCERPRGGARQRGAPLAGRGRGAPLTGLDRRRSSEARASGRSVEVAEPTARRTSRWRSAGTEHLGTLLLHGVPDGLGTADRRTLERGALVTALVLLFGRTVAEAEERVRGELLSDLLERPRPRPRPAARAGPPPARRPRRPHRRRGGRRRGRRAAPGRPGGRPARRRAAAAWPASTTAGWCWSRRPTDAARGRPAAARAGARRRRLRARSGSPPPPAAPADVADGLRARPGGASDTLLTLGRDRRGQRPGRPRAGPAAAGPERPGGARRVHREPWSGRCWPTTSGAAPSWSAPWRRGSPPAPVPRETAKRLHVHPNTVAQRLDRIGTLLGDDWRDPARGLDVQLALRLYRLRAR